MSHFNKFKAYLRTSNARKSTKTGIFINRFILRARTPKTPLLSFRNKPKHKFYWYSTPFLRALTNRALQWFIRYYDSAGTPNAEQMLPYFSRAAIPFEGTIQMNALGTYFLTKNRIVTYIGKCSRFAGRKSAHKKSKDKDFDHAVLFPSKTFYNIENLLIGLLRPSTNIAGAHGWEVGILRKGFIESAFDVWIFLFCEGVLGESAGARLIQTLYNASTREPLTDRLELKRVLRAYKAQFEELGVIIPEEYYTEKTSNYKTLQRKPIH